MRALCEELARLGGRVHLRYFRKEMAVATKSAHQDLVTSADLEAEEAIVLRIRERFPDHDIVGEEGRYEKTGSRFSWAIDPLDGTNNFAHTIPIFACSVALLEGGVVKAGAVYDPMRKELFSAARGEGAYLNGERIGVTDRGTLHGTVLATGFYYDRGEPMRKTLAIMKRAIPVGVVNILRPGAAALDLCWVAAGRLDGFFEHKLSLWDYAAGWLLVEEASGTVADWEGKPLAGGETSVIASNGKVHQELLGLVKQ